MNYKVCHIALAAIGLMGLVSCTSAYPHLETPPAIEAITAASATPLSFPISKSFGSLVAMVTTNGSAATGVVVTFKAPTTGASGTFADTGTGTTTAKTDASGLATSAAFTANKTAGSYMVVASAPGAPALADFNLTNSTGAPAAVIATGGDSQTVGINSAFPAPFLVTVQDSGQNPISGALVVFKAPATGASGTFANGLSSETDTTNASGVATSTVFTANKMSGADVVTATVPGASTQANFNLTNAPGPPATVTATSGISQSASIDTAFLSPFVVTVLDSFSNPVSGVAVTFTAPATLASGTFANGQPTETDTTNASGVATSSQFSANGTTGTYTVMATLTSGGAPATFSLTNRVTSNTYVFYLSGQEVFGPDFYALVGSVEVDASGNILAGEQDYNDGFQLTSPQPSGDTITGGSLTVDSTTGQGTLTLNTSNTNLGVGGIETIGVQFVNSNHALVIQFDGSATSSGSMDLQNLSSSLTDGGYAFTLFGLDQSFLPVAFGGVFSISGGTTLQNGLLDTNDGGAVTTQTTLSGTLSAVDSFGRGTIASTINYSGSPVSLNYYVVGPEVIRIIDVDPSDSAVGSAFGQGTNATSSTNASLGNSVFGLAGSPFPTNYAAAGILNPSNTSSSPADFSGIADDNELALGVPLTAAPISGTYSIANTGYGSLTIASAALGDVSLLGIYMTDPNLNLCDPNNPSGVGGALIVDLDPTLAGGTGMVIPQTDTSTASFTNNYAFDAQSYNSFLEFDFVGQGSVTSGTLTGTGLLSDPFLTFGAIAQNFGVTFSGTPLPDPSNAGRYTMSSTNPTPNPLAITPSGLSPSNFDLVIYQASGGQLLWLNEDPTTVFLGSLQQQGSLTGLPAARKGISRTKVKQKAGR